MKKTSGRGKTVNGLTNVQNACVYLLQKGSERNAANIRRYMHLQRHGTLDGFTRGTYVSYFTGPGYYHKGSRYVGALWGKLNGAWILTDEGHDVAFNALKELEIRSGCWITTR